jgi:hypothetical protein
LVALPPILQRLLGKKRGTTRALILTPSLFAPAK